MGRPTAEVRISAIGTGLAKRIDGLARLEFTGRTTGKEYRVVRALHDVDGRDAVLTNSGWRHNFEGGRPLAVTVGGESRQMVGTLEDDPEEVARVYAGRIEELGVGDPARRLGIKINVDREPTHEELRDLAAGEGLSVIYLSEN